MKKKTETEKGSFSAERMWAVVNKLNSTKGAFKSRAVMEAWEELVVFLNDPDYDPAETAAAVDAIGLEMENKLTLGEAYLMRDILNGIIMDHRQSRTRAQMLSREVEKGCRRDGLDKKWKVDGKALAEKVGSLPPSQAWWLVHQVCAWFGELDNGPVDDDVTRRLFRITK